jgi:hypothetical protein
VAGNGVVAGPNWFVPMRSAWVSAMKNGWSNGAGFDSGDAGFQLSMIREGKPVRSGQLHRSWPPARRQGQGHDKLKGGPGKDVRIQ